METLRVATVALPKKGNLERHFKTVHKSYDADFPAKSALRTRKVRELKGQLAAQQSIFTRPNTKGKAATIASYRVSHVLAKHKKSFKDGEVVKEAFVEAADALFGDFKNKSDIIAAIKDVQISRGTVTRRCEGMAEDIEEQLRKDVEQCKCFSLQFDESTDVVDVAQLCVFIRMVFGDMGAKEELLTILPLKGHTRGEDIFQAFMEFVNKTQLPLFKLISITTDGAPAMVGRTSGFIALCKQSEYFPDFLNYHCIIHQQALCSKILNMKEVMDVAMKIVCSVRARSLQRRLFRAHLEETEYAQLEDYQWLLDLAFLTDLTDLLNGFNLELQGKDKHVINMISAVNSFKSKLQLLSNRLQRYDLRNFPHMQAELQRQGKDFVQLDSARFEEQVQSILLEFERRFTDFGSIEPVASYLCFPSGPSIDVDCVASKIVSLFHLDNTAVENEILTLQNDIEIKSRATSDMNGEFWLATSSYCPDYEKLAASSQCQRSH
ncbi:unnamed protein product [Leuciscus chuanchicus]